MGIMNKLFGSATETMAVSESISAAVNEEPAADLGLLVWVCPNCGKPLGVHTDGVEPPACCPGVAAQRFDATSLKIDRNTRLVVAGRQA